MLSKQHYILFSSFQNSFLGISYYLLPSVVCSRNTFLGGHRDGEIKKEGIYIHIYFKNIISNTIWIITFCEYDHIGVIPRNPYASNLNVTKASTR